jgi:hypothetical protein
MTPENAASAVVQPGELTPENAKLLAEYADHLEHAPLSGPTPRSYLGAVRAYLAWLEQAEVDGDPLTNAAAKDWAVRDYRSYLVTVAKRAAATVNKRLTRSPASLSVGGGLLWTAAFRRIRVVAGSPTGSLTGCQRSQSSSHTGPRSTCSDGTSSHVCHHPATQRVRLILKQVSRTVGAKRGPGFFDGPSVASVSTRIAGLYGAQ